MSQPFSEIDANHTLTSEEVKKLREDGGKPADTLMNVVALIADRFNTDVCSAYLLEPDRSNLVLAASLGLHPACIGTLRMPLNEGLAGLVAEQVLPVAVDDVRKHSRFKYFKESGEDEYHSFLGVPLSTAASCKASSLFKPRTRGSFATLRFACWWKRQTRWRRWSARPAHSIDSLAPPRNGCGPWPGTSGGVGTMTASVCFAIWLPPAGAN